MKTSLILMAGGLGSRFKGGVKALAQVGPNGENIMDYSVHDAILAGFDRVIFVISKKIEEDFADLLYRRIAAVCKVHEVECRYVIQDIDDVPFRAVEGRTKPWGTCHAVLAARKWIDGPFCVLNADDFYGKMAFRKIYYFLTHSVRDNEFCMAGFKIMRTLSENGGVTRGLCSLDFDGQLSSIRETKHIIPMGDHAEADGKSIAPNAIVSMNMWGFTKHMLTLLETGFETFLQELTEPMTEEFLLPVYVGKLLDAGKITVKVLPSSDRWFGVTYIEDQPMVIDAIRGLIERGEYSENLFSDIPEGKVCSRS